MSVVDTEKSPFRFIDLPVNDVRFIVYGYDFYVSENDIEMDRETWYAGWQAPDRQQYRRRRFQTTETIACAVVDVWTAPMQLQSALLGSCRTVHQEASPFFYQINKVTFSCANRMRQFLDNIGSEKRQHPRHVTHDVHGTELSDPDWRNVVPFVQEAVQLESMTIKMFPNLKLGTTYHFVLAMVKLRGIANVNFEGMEGFPKVVTHLDKG